MFPSLVQWNDSNERCLVGCDVVLCTISFIHTKKMTKETTRGTMHCPAENKMAHGKRYNGNVNSRSKDEES